MYRITGRQLFFDVSRSVCEECDLTVATVGRVIKDLERDVRVNLRVRPWLNDLPLALLRGAYHPPVVLVEGKVLSQGVVPDEGDVRRAIQEVASPRAVGDRPGQRDLSRTRKLHLEFEYDLPAESVHAWWTDLSGTGYVGKALKSIRPVGRDGEKILVETKWRIMGMPVTLVEKFTLHSKDHWTWEPHLLGIHMTDEFRVAKDADGKARLTIDSTISPRGMKGRVMGFLLGRRLERMMKSEWESASEAFVEEIGTKRSEAQR